MGHAGSLLDRQPRIRLGLVHHDLALHPRHGGWGRNLLWTGLFKAGRSETQTRRRQSAHPSGSSRQQPRAAHLCNRVGWWRNAHPVADILENRDRADLLRIHPAQGRRRVRRGQFPRPVRKHRTGPDRSRCAEGLVTMRGGCRVAKAPTAAAERDPPCACRQTGKATGSRYQGRVPRSRSG